MSAADVAAYRRMSDREQREFRRTFAARVVEVVPERPIAAVPSVPSTPRSGAREIVEAFERGDESLFGFPRARVDFVSVYEVLGGR